MRFDLSFKGIREFINEVIDILIPLILVSLLLGIIFGPDTPFVGDVYTNVSNVIAILGQDGLLALISIVIILAYLKK